MHGKSALRDRTSKESRGPRLALHEVDQVARGVALRMQHRREQVRRLRMRHRQQLAPQHEQRRQRIARQQRERRRNDEIELLMLHSLRRGRLLSSRTRCFTRRALVLMRSRVGQQRKVQTEPSARIARGSSSCRWPVRHPLSKQRVCQPRASNKC